MLVFSGYGIFFSRRRKELKLDGWSWELWHNSDSKDAEPQINWLTLLGEQQNTSKLSGQYSFPISILATLGLSITFIKLPNSRTGD